MSQSASESVSHSRFLTLLIGCIGVVYGDIGTSPLYAFREAALQVSSDGLLNHEIYGILSLIIWTLLIIVTLKYVLFLLRTDNKGEGGVLSLMALARKGVGRKNTIIFFAGAIGAALFYGDAAITPAISVLSAVEGLKLATPAFEHYILPITILILFLLFFVQKTGTGRVSTFFGPITVIWFIAIAASGTHWIIEHPSILLSFSPIYAVNFLFSHGTLSFFVLGAVFLSVTGAEALYADLGHFGRKPIQRAWIFLVFPALVLNYLGQGALLLVSPAAIENPFYLLVPAWALLPMIGLATAATIIASQAVITGAFSLTSQAILLGLLPRMEIRHTSAMEKGQIYIPQINLLLLFSVLFLCFVFRTSGGLAAAYGIAVTGTMLVTTLLAYFVVADVWKKGHLIAAAITLPFFAIESVFLVANLMKVFHGGFVPLVFGGFVVLLMSTWVAGTRFLYRKNQENSIPVEDLVQGLDRHPPHIVEHAAIFLTSDPGTAPECLVQNLRHNQILHEHNIMLTVVIADDPVVPPEERFNAVILSDRMMRVTLNFGYMETPDVPQALKMVDAAHLGINIDKATYFVSRRKIVSDPSIGLPGWQDRLYIMLATSSVTATDFFKLPRNQVIEIGVQIAV